MWYRCDVGSAPENRDWDSMACYAESTDGVAWEKPNLGLVDFEGLDSNLFITFTLGFYGPGDPLEIFYNEELVSDPVINERLRALHGLDQPFYIQFTDYFTGLVRGDWGTSIASNRPIWPTFAASMPISAQLGVASMIVLIVVGIPLGALAAVKQNTWIDYIVVFLAISVRSVPVFVLAPMMLIVLVLWLDLMNVPIGWKGIFSTNAIMPVFLMAAGPLLGA